MSTLDNSPMLTSKTRPNFSPMISESTQFFKMGFHRAERYNELTDVYETKYERKIRSTIFTITKISQTWMGLTHYLEGYNDLGEFIAYKNFESLEKAQEFLARYKNGENLKTLISEDYAEIVRESMLQTYPVKRSADYLGAVLRGMEFIDNDGIYYEYVRGTREIVVTIGDNFNYVTTYYRNGDTIKVVDTEMFPRENYNDICRYILHWINMSDYHFNIEIGD